MNQNIQQVTTVHVAEKAMHKVLEEVIGESLGHAAIESAAHFGGAVMHGAISSGVATHKTIKNKRKVKLYEKTEGLSGFSRTKYKREKTKDWSGAAVGTGASIAGGMAGMTVGTVMKYFINFRINLIFKAILNYYAFYMNTIYLTMI